MRDTEKITTLHKKYTEEKTLANIREQKRERLIRTRKAAIIIIGSLALFLTSLPLLKKHQQTVKYREEYEKSQQQLSELKELESDLEYQVTLLENEEYIAKLARSEYHLTKDNEVIFKFPEHLDEEDSKETEEEDTDKVENEN